MGKGHFRGNIKTGLKKPRVYGKKRQNARPNPKNGEIRDSPPGKSLSAWAKDAQRAIDKADSIEKIKQAYKDTGLARYLIGSHLDEALDSLKSAKSLYEDATGTRLKWIEGDSYEEFWKNFVKVVSAIQIYKDNKSTNLGSVNYFRYATRLCLVAAECYAQDGRNDIAKKYLSIVDTIVHEKGVSLSEENRDYYKLVSEKAYGQVS